MASEARPAGVPAWTRSGNRLGGISAQAHASSHHRREFTSSAPVRVAKESSATSCPPRHRTIHSATLSHRRPLTEVGSCARSQRYLATLHDEVGGSPVCAEKLVEPRSSDSR